MQIFKFGLIGKKAGMTKIFNKEGHSIPVTVLEVGPCNIVQKRTEKKEGYNAIQIGFGEKKEKNISKPRAGQFKKRGMQLNRYLREIRLNSEEITKFNEKDTLKVSDHFKAGDIIDVIGISKGKGFAGVMKRHNFGGSSATRGTHEHFRHGGSIGMHTYPARIFKNTKMPGHMGDEKVTIQNLKVVEVKADDNILLVRGAVPGAKNGLIVVQHAKKKTQVKQKKSK